MHRPALAPENAGGAANIGSGSQGFAGNGAMLTGTSVGVLDMTADESALYWVEYGTRDALGNYQNDGALMSHTFADDETHVLASKLPGPLKLAVTSEHVYVFTDGAGLVGSAVDNRIWRLPKAGGSRASVGKFVTARVATSGDSLYLNDDGEWRVTTGEGTWSTFLPGVQASNASADGDALYYTVGQGPIVRAPLSGTTAGDVAPYAFTFALSGASVFGLENVPGDGVVLDEVAKAGGAWRRIRALGSGNPVRVQARGSRYFAVTFPETLNYRASVVTGSLIANTPLVRLGVADPSAYDYLTFAVSDTTVFWSDLRGIYARPVSDAADTP